MPVLLHSKTPVSRGNGVVPQQATRRAHTPARSRRPLHGKGQQVRPGPLRRLVHAYYARKRRKEMWATYAAAQHYYRFGNFDLANQYINKFHEMQKELNP